MSKFIYIYIGCAVAETLGFRMYGWGLCGAPLRAIVVSVYPHPLPASHLSGQRRMGGAGGYVGDGVTMSYVAGRCLAEMITGQRSVWTIPSPYALPFLRDVEPVGKWEVRGGGGRVGGRGAWRRG